MRLNCAAALSGQPTTSFVQSVGLTCCCYAVGKLDDMLHECDGCRDLRNLDRQTFFEQTDCRQPTQQNTSKQQARAKLKREPATPLCGWLMKCLLPHRYTSS